MFVIILKKNWTGWMTMNLNTLFKKQMELDAHITQKRNLEGQPLLDKRIVALICELYECINEARFFKFWSDDQKPRYEGIETIIHGYCSESGRADIEERQTRPLLEEYADDIHFALSDANSLGVHEHDYIE